MSKSITQATQNDKQISKSVVRRHIVGGANRTLFSANLSPRLCRIGTCRRLSAD